MAKISIFSLLVIISICCIEFSVAPPPGLRDEQWWVPNPDCPRGGVYKINNNSIRCHCWGFQGYICEPDFGGSGRGNGRGGGNNGDGCPPGATVCVINNNSNSNSNSNSNANDNKNGNKNGNGNKNKKGKNNNNDYGDYSQYDQ